MACGAHFERPSAIYLRYIVETDIRAVGNRRAAQAAWEGLNEGARVFELGQVRLAVISLLANGPRHGYGIMKDLRERLGPRYRGSSGSVYPALKQLESEGLVTCETQAGRKQFTLTRTGKRELAKNAEACERIWRRIDESQTSPLPVDGDVPTLLQRLLRAVYSASEASVGRPGLEAALRGLLGRMAAELETFKTETLSEKETE